MYSHLLIGHSVSSLVEYLFRYVVHFKIGLFAFLSLSCNIYSRTNLVSCFLITIFFSFCELPFHLMVSLEVKKLNFDDGSLLFLFLVLQVP